MQVSVENTSSIGRRLTVNIPAEQVQTEINQRMNEVLQHKRIDGFRPGKVPKQLLQQKFGAQIRNEAVGKIIESSLPTVLRQQALEPAGMPAIERVLNIDEDGKDLTYVVVFEIFPEFALPEYSKIQIEQFQAEVKEPDVDQMLDRLRNQLATWTSVERAAKMGDKLVIDYTSTISGKSYENNSGQDIEVELGTKAFIEGFEAGLLNAKAGETCALDLEFPADWRSKKLAGKPVHFSVEIKEVSEKQLPELDQAFADKIGASSGELSDIRNKVRENLKEQVGIASLELAKKQILDKLLSLCEIELPKALIEKEMAALHEDMHRKMGDKAHDTCHHQGLEDEAIRRVSLSLILRKVVKSENLKPNPAKVKEKIAQIAKSFGNAEFIENMYYESEELMSGVQNTELVEQAVDLILGKASLVQKPITVEELFKRD